MRQLANRSVRQRRTGRRHSLRATVRLGDQHDQRPSRSQAGTTARPPGSPGPRRVPSRCTKPQALPTHGVGRVGGRQCGDAVALRGPPGRRPAPVVVGEPRARPVVDIDQSQLRRVLQRPGPSAAGNGRVQRYGRSGRSPSPAGTGRRSGRHRATTPGPVDGRRPRRGCAVRRSPDRRRPEPCVRRARPAARGAAGRVPRRRLGRRARHPAGSARLRCDVDERQLDELVLGAFWDSSGGEGQHTVRRGRWRGTGRERRTAGRRRPRSTAARGQSSA